MVEEEEIRCGGEVMERSTKIENNSSRASSDGDKSSDNSNSGSRNGNVRKGSFVTRKSLDYSNCLPIR